MNKTKHEQLLQLLSLTKSCKDEAKLTDMFVIDSDIALEQAYKQLPEKVYVDNAYLRQLLGSLLVDNQTLIDKLQNFLAQTIQRQTLLRCCLIKRLTIKQLLEHDKSN